VERRVQDYKLLRDPKYKLLRELKKEGKTVESGVIELDEDDEGNPRGQLCEQEERCYINCRLIR